MADTFLSSSGTPALNYETWAKAAASWSVAHGNLSAGFDQIIIASDYSESSLGDFTTWPGSRDDPINVISADKTAGGSVITYERGASLTFSVDADFASLADGVNIFGLDIACNNNWRIDAAGFAYDCEFSMTGTNDAIRSIGKRIFENCRFSQTIDATSSMLYADNDETLVHVHDCSILSGNDGDVFIWAGNGGYWYVHGADLTNLASGGDLIELPSSSNGGGLQVYGYGIKLPASGGVIHNSIANDQRVEVYSVATSGSVPGFHVEDRYGTATENVDTYRSGSYDGTDDYSVEIEPKATTTEITNPFRFRIFQKLLTSANPTLTVEFLYDSTTILQNDVLWLEVFHPDATNPVMQKIDTSSRCVIGATPANLSAGVGTGSWTQSMTNPNSRRIAVTVSSGGAGLHVINVCYAPNAATPDLFVCPDVTVA